MAITRNFAAFKSQDGNIVPRTAYFNYTTDADIQVTNANKGQLHELNYFLRLVSFDV